MKKYIKYMIILVIIVGILIGVNYLFKPSVKEEIESYLIKNGYVEGEYTDLYVKKESDSKTNSFSLGDYTLMTNIDDTVGGMNTSLNATYDYKTEIITYSYRVNYDESLNVWFKGTYQDNNFTCDKEFSSSTLTESSIENICSLANTSIKLFDLEAKTLFTKYKYVDYIKNR